MKTVNALGLTQVLTTVVVLLLRLRSTHSNPIIHPATPAVIQPLCISQFALANHACASIPTVFLPPPRQTTQPPPPVGPLGPSLAESTSNAHFHHHHRHHGHHHQGGGGGGHHLGGGVGHHHHQGGGGGGGGHHMTHQGHHLEGHHGNHHHNHGGDHHDGGNGDNDNGDDHNDDGDSGDHGDDHRDHQTESQRECCRWLRAVDDMCVCDLLVYLPVFLSRPVHGYTVVVDDECEVQFECQGRRLLASRSPSP